MSGPDNDFKHVTFISAGAGSGKTYRLTKDLEQALIDGVEPAGVIGTTFTVKAAGELKGRVRERLIQSGRPRLAAQMTDALLGTVHSVCERLLKKFSFELGLSPHLNVISIEDGNRFFSRAMDEVLDLDHVRAMNALANRLAQDNWQGAVKAVADRVRENDIAAPELAAMAVDSADTFLGYFGDVSNQTDLSRHLATTIDAALNDIDLSRDTTKTTRDYVRDLHYAQRALQRPDCPWSTWIRLSAVKAAKTSEPIAATVREAAAHYAVHPQFHADVRRYVTTILELAGRTLVRFQVSKTEHGLIDFLDMEQLALRALDNVEVVARVREELDLLLVDEFQDTNPMQLALFVKLATLADRAIFVGDVKQAIYAFRGCDPDLVFETLKGLSAASAETDILPNSWRSRPSLVHYINEVFATAFESQMHRDAVVLKPEREEQTLTPAVATWTLPKTVASRADALAAGIAQLITSSQPIVDPDSNTPRPVTWGDIAVLARTNQHVEQIARTLKNNNIPMKMTLAGLLAVPETLFAIACLRRLNDPTDTLATAEIISLADSADAETWLANRLQWLADAKPAFAWAQDDHPIIARLQQLRASSQLRTPVEVVAHVLNDVGARRIAAGWGPDAIKAAQRQRNLDAFLNLAVEYERHCQSQFEAATLTGFLFWLEKPTSADLDLQPVVTTGNAVHVLTYHRAKGLEWPVVIVTDFDARERTDLWGVRVDLTADFNVNAPLANRTIRFWPNVFGSRTKNLPPLDQIIASADGVDIAKRSQQEQQRLAYVGMTRARDVLVLALPEQVGRDKWLSTFATDFTVPTGDDLLLPNGVSVPSAARTYEAAEPAPQPNYTPVWFAQRPRTDDQLMENLPPSSAEPIDTASAATVIELGARITVHGDDMTTLGSSLHAIIAAVLVNPDRADAAAMSEAILAAHGASHLISGDDCLTAAHRFRAAIDKQFSPKAIHAEYPIEHASPTGRRSKGWADVALDTEIGWIIIDHKSSPRPKSQWRIDAQTYSGQLAAYRAAFEAAGERVAGCWLHFPISGGLVEVTW